MNKRIDRDHPGRSAITMTTLLTENEVEFTHINTGDGVGLTILRCRKIGFEKEIDCYDQHRSQKEAMAHLGQAAFDAFRSGQLVIAPPERQSQAEQLVALCDRDLIRDMYSPDLLVEELAKYELQRRGLLDVDIYRIGHFGNADAKRQAIELMTLKAEQNTSTPDGAD